MLSARSKLEVKAILKMLELHYIFVDLGEVEIMENISEEIRIQLKDELEKIGLELMEDKKASLVNKIKNAIIELIHNDSDEKLKINYSEYLSRKLDLNYTYLSNLFSEVHGTTIEYYIIAHKIERIKELMIYDEMNITEIAWKLNYSSVAHLSNQFKKNTGLTPSQFKSLKNKIRRPVEEIGLSNTK